MEAWAGASSEAEAGLADRTLSTAEQYFLTGSLLDDGSPEHATRRRRPYRRALEEDPDLVAALINLANIRYSRDELAEAQALYERAIVLDRPTSRRTSTSATSTTITAATSTPKRPTAMRSALNRPTPTRTSISP